RHRATCSAKRGMRRTRRTVAPPSRPGGARPRPPLRRSPPPTPPPAKGCASWNAPGVRRETVILQTPEGGKGGAGAERGRRSLHAGGFLGGGQQVGGLLVGREQLQGGLEFGDGGLGLLGVQLFLAGGNVLVERRQPGRLLRRGLLVGGGFGGL